MKDVIRKVLGIDFAGTEQECSVAVLGHWEPDGTIVVEKVVRAWPEECPRKYVESKVVEQKSLTA